MVKCSFVLALKSRNKVREIVTLDLEMREIDGIVRSCKLTETANGGYIFIFCRGFRLLEVQLLTLFFWVLADDAGEGI